MKTAFPEITARVATAPPQASTKPRAHDEPVAAQGAGTPTLYGGFDGQYIDRSWRSERHGGVQVDTDPYSGETLAETTMANQADLDEAYHAAARAQISWAARLPTERATVMLRSAAIMEARHDEIVDWLIRWILHEFTRDHWVTVRHSNGAYPF